MLEALLKEHQQDVPSIGDGIDQSEEEDEIGSLGLDRLKVGIPLPIPRGLEQHESIGEWLEISPQLDVGRTSMGRMCEGCSWGKLFYNHEGSLN